MGTAYLYGNGGSGGGAGGFGLQIVEGLVRPKNPTQGMIWAKTEHKVTYYDLSATKPENPIDGTLWISISDSGDRKIVSPISKEWITVYPLSAEQYINGAWVTIETVSYQDGEWVEWWNGELFDNGNQFEAITGGWTQFPGLALSDTSYPNTGTVSIGDTIRIETPYSAVSAIATTKNKIDLTDYSQIMFVVDEASALSSSSTADMSCQVHDNTTGKIGSVAVKTVNTTGTAYVDISNVSGMHYVSVQNGYGRTHSISKVKLIK